jgi:hypothetical protein
VLFRVAVVCNKSSLFSTGMTAIDRVDRIRVMVIAGARFWDHQSVLCLTQHSGDAVNCYRVQNWARSPERRAVLSHSTDSRLVSGPNLAQSILVMPWDGIQYPSSNFRIVHNIPAWNLGWYMIY